MKATTLLLTLLLAGPTATCSAPDMGGTDGAPDSDAGTDRGPPPAAGPRLEELGVLSENGELDPAFDPEVMEYDACIEDLVASFVLDGAGDALFSIDGTEPDTVRSFLRVEAQDFGSLEGVLDVRVASPDGEEALYTINLSFWCRPPPSFTRFDFNGNDDLVVTPAYDPEQREYDVYADSDFVQAHLVTTSYPEHRVDDTFYVDGEDQEGFAGGGTWARPVDGDMVEAHFRLVDMRGQETEHVARIHFPSP